MTDISTTAEDIVDALLATDGVDEYDLLVHMFDNCPEKIRDKFVGDIQDQYELYTLDEACEALNDAKSI
jgi:hypothetical protein